MTNDLLAAYFAYAGKTEAYARAQWAYMTGQGPLPDHRQFGLTDSQAQAVRIRLAQLK